MKIYCKCICDESAYYIRINSKSYIQRNYLIQIFSFRFHIHYIRLSGLNIYLVCDIRFIMRYKSLSYGPRTNKKCGRAPANKGVHIEAYVIT